MHIIDIRPGQIVRYKFDHSATEWTVKGTVIINIGFVFPKQKKVRRLVELHGTTQHFFARDLILVKDVR